MGDETSPAYIDCTMGEFSMAVQGGEGDDLDDVTDVFVDRYDVMVSDFRDIYDLVDDEDERSMY